MSRARRRKAEHRILLKTPEQIGIMREGGRILARTLKAAGDLIQPGVTTAAIDGRAAEVLAEAGAEASFLGLYDFPASVCVAVNDAVVHGIPSADVVLREGDIVGIDLGVFWRGLHVDGAATFAVGMISKRVKKLMQATRESLALGIEAAQSGAHLRDVSRAIQEYIEDRRGYSCVRALCGHGIGLEVHEAPQVPNYVSDDPGPVLEPGMTLAIEPMVNMGSCEVYTDGDGWAVRTSDGKPSAHFEHTVAVTERGPDVLTLP